MSRTDEQFAQAMATVMQRYYHTLEEIKDKVPRGFWLYVLHELNHSGARSPTGEPWGNRGMISVYWKRHQSDITRHLEALLPGGDPQAHTETPNTWVESTDTPVHTEKNTMMQDLHAMMPQLKEMAEWWEQRPPDIRRTGLEIRPEIGRGEKVSNSIYCDRELLDRAKRAAKANRVATGGSLSTLVELLLWQHLGEPEDLLKPDTEA